MDFNNVITIFNSNFISTRIQKKIYLRNDNSSQVIADLVKNYFKDKYVDKRIYKA